MARIMQAKLKSIHMATIQFSKMAKDLSVPTCLRIPFLHFCFLRKLVLFSVTILYVKNLFVCFVFQIDTIAGIRHSAIQGHSIVMIQTDDIHESFYDLFNRRFKQIDIPVPHVQPNPEPHDSKPGDSKPGDQLQQDDSKPDDQIDKSSTRLYANIAIGAHLKPCRVHPSFKCIVALKKSELEQTPAPFLNRFEKYCITHEDIYECVLKRLPTGLRSVVETAYEKV